MPTAKSANDRCSLVETIVDSDIIIRAVLGSRTDRPHGTSHDVLAALSINVELFIFNVKFDKRLSSIEPVFAVQSSRINSRIGRTLYVTGLKSTVVKTALAIRIRYYDSTTIRIKFRMLAVTQIDFVLLLGSRIKAEVCLICKVVRVKENFDDARFRYKCLRLLGFTAKYTLLLAIVHFGLLIAVYYLYIKRNFF